MIYMKDAIREPTNVDEEGFIEHVEEEDCPLDLPQEKRVVYVDRNDRSISELKDWVNTGDLDLAPAFQRSYVWDDKKASLLVESILLKIPIPSIYLAEEEDGKYTIVDGQQRLRSFIRFIDNEFKLKKLMLLTDIEGKLFKDLDEDMQKKIRRASLPTIEIRKDTTPIVKFEIFERLNVGSVKLTDQELRNCVYRGKYNNLIKELSEDKCFLHLLGFKNKIRDRMQEREFVLHFLAFYNQTYLEYKSPMKQFLNREMENNKTITDEKIMLMRQAFIDAIFLTNTVFGEKGFRRFTLGNQENPNSKWKKPINIGLFEITMCGFKKYKRDHIIEYGDVIKEKLIDLMTLNQDFISSVGGTGTTSTYNVRLRFKIWEEALKNIVGIPKTYPRPFSLEFKSQLFKQNPTCQICGNEILLLEDAVVNKIDHYGSGEKTVENNAHLTHIYCNQSTRIKRNDLNTSRISSYARNDCE